MTQPNPNIDDGLAALWFLNQEGLALTHEEIAAYCGCTSSYIWLLEQSALRKLRCALIFRKDPILTEAMAQFFDRRQPCSPTKFLHAA